MEATSVPVLATVVAVHPLCPACRRPVTLRADVVVLADGRRAIAAGGLRRALATHLRRCEP